MSIKLPSPPSPSQPLSQWAAIAVAAITALSAHFTSVGQDQFDGTVEKVTAFEDGQYEAIVDLRRKVDFLFRRVMEIEVEKASGAVKPPGPAQVFSPPAPSDAGIEPDADADVVEQPDFLPPSPPKKELVPQPRKEKPVVDEYGMPVWEPLNKQMEQKAQ